MAQLFVKFKKIKMVTKLCFYWLYILIVHISNIHLKYKINILCILLFVFLCYNYLVILILMRPAFTLEIEELTGPVLSDGELLFISNRGTPW